MRPSLLGLIALAIVAFAGVADAHATRSASIRITEVTPGRAAVTMGPQQPGDDVRVRLGPPCTETTPAERGRDTTAPIRVECGPTLAGVTLTVDGLGALVTQAIVVYSFADGRTGSRVVTASAPSFELPEAQRPVDVAASYVRLGVRHIFTGYDHLLFLVALVLLLRRTRAVLAAETAFTLSHSLSFSAAALGWVRVSPAAAEACIALSLVLVALDIGRRSPSVRHGSGVALAFGFVHGLGFAGGLSEIGVPDRDIAEALAGFAVGVEVGQIAFIVAILVALASIAKRVDVRRVEPFLAALVGGISIYWLAERWRLCI